MNRRLLLADIREAAQGRIKNAQFKGAETAAPEIEVVGQAIARKYDGVIAKAPLKSRERASEKVAQDYGGDWYDIKDIARMTIVVPEYAQCESVMQDLKREFTPSKHRGFVQEKVVNPEVDPCGYSGMTAFVKTTNQRVAEIQINIPEIIYGKSSAGTVQRVLGASAYFALRGKFQIDGGFGHILYEIYRVAPGSPKGAAAAALSKRYYAYLRRGIADPRLASDLNDRVSMFRTAYPRLFLPH